MTRPLLRENGALFTYITFAILRYKYLYDHPTDSSHPYPFNSLPETSSTHPLQELEGGIILVVLLAVPVATLRAGGQVWSLELSSPRVSQL